MNEFQLRVEVQRQVAAASADLKRQLDTAVAERNAARALADRAVIDTGVGSAAMRSGNYRPGAETQIVAAARAAGWKNVNGQLLQVDGDGQVVGRSIGEWLTQHRGEMVPLLAPEVIDRRDKEAIGRNIEAIARGDVRVGP